jgi:hypothetical protein
MNLTKFLLFIVGLFCFSALAIYANANINDSLQQSCERFGGKPNETIIQPVTHVAEVTWYLLRNKVMWTYSASFDDQDRCDEVRYVCWGPLDMSEIINIIRFNFPEGEKVHEIPMDAGREWINDTQDEFATMKGVTSTDKSLSGMQIEFTTRSFFARINK